ncbi:TolC family outer membrane protein [Azonexus caeni]|uniref:TolC family outer membrane protein n=1 Tax=Azonexus caeni TaxID=266126 RepID=UPI003A8BE1B0
MTRLKTLPWLLASLALPLHAQQPAAPEVQQALRQVAQQAVQKSPEVTIKWRNYKAAEEEVGVARGGYFPKLDLTAGAGRESLEVPGSAKDTYTRRGYALTLSQMLFDGFATRSEVRKLGKAKLVRYYELLEASENVALEASKAYVDVLRYRSLVALAEDNYVRHKATYEQIKARTASGVGRRVDLEQAGSRLALAEVNLTTETANLHDVMARYQRLVGELPAATLTPQQLPGAALPASPKAALDVLYKRNPTLLAAVENIEAAQYDVEGRRAAYMPRIDLRARTETTKNYQGVSGDRDQNVAEVVMSWNLFNGGSDTARERQYVERKHMALEMREKACRDTRQTLLIAYNDVQRLSEQKANLTTQVALLEKTRDAYRDQFNVGQRTLLDLLDTENELLSAKRSLVNADTDLTLAYLRSQAGMGSLLEFMGLQKLETATPEASELAEVDAATLCPPEPVALTSTPRADLDARAQDMLGKKPPVVTPPAPASDADVQARIRAWAQAWSAKDYTAYTAFYAPGFTPDRGLSRDAWDRLRRTRIMPRERISVTVDKLDVQMHGADRATAQFEQTYRSNLYNDRVLKTLQMVRQNSQWLITGETAVPCRGNTVGGCSPGQR